jgi:serine/threonine-protein kinase
LEPTTLENVNRRFGREARNGIRILCEHIVCYRDYGEIKNHPVLVMDLADESLATRLTKGHLSVSESLSIVACCASGLRHLHEIDCVHRDVKPPNILRFGSQFVLGDLGIVKWSDLNASFTSAATITKAVVQLGSWYYMAPEQRQSPHDATPASDIYALGISWYEMLTGVTPDPAAVGAQAFADPSSVPAVNDLIRRMLKYDPSSRPTAEEVMRLAHSISATDS